MQESYQSTAASQALKASKPGKRRRNKNGLVIILVVALVVVAALAAFFFWRYHQANKNPQAQIEQKNNAETQKVLGGLQKIIFIPSDAPAPTVAKVENVSELKKTNPEFYKDIQTGDYLVLYPNRAIIYRQSSGQIINIAPIIDVNSGTKQG